MQFDIDQSRDGLTRHFLRAFLVSRDAKIQESCFGRVLRGERRFVSFLNLFPSLSNLRALRALLSSFCELTRTFSVTQTHSVTFVPSKYTYNHGDGEDEREHLPQVRTKSIFFSLPSIQKALSLLPGCAHQSLSEGHLEAKEKKKSKSRGPELFSF